MNRPIEISDPAILAKHVIAEGRGIARLVTPAQPKLELENQRLLIAADRPIRGVPEWVKVVRYGRGNLEVLDAEYFPGSEEIDFPGLKDTEPEGKFRSKLRYRARGLWLTREKTDDPQKVAGRMEDIFRAVWVHNPDKYKKFVTQLISGK